MLGESGMMYAWILVSHTVAGAVRASSNLESAMMALRLGVIFNPTTKWIGSGLGPMNQLCPGWNRKPSSPKYYLFFTFKPHNLKPGN